MQLKFEIEYDHIAYILGPKGQQIKVGIVLVHEENKTDSTASILVKLDQGLPPELVKALQQEPRMLNYVKIAKKSTGIVVLPEIGDV